MSSVHPEVFGRIITRSSGKPSAAERVTGWLRSMAPLRAAAEAGDESAMECAPNVIPMRRPLVETNPERAVDDYCEMRNMPSWIKGEAKRVVRMKLRDGVSGRTAYDFGVIRADFCRFHGIDPHQPRRPSGGAAA